MMVTRAFKPKGRQLRAEGSAGVPRIAKLMALAICFDQLIKEGVVADQAELARVGKVTRARVTQILDLNNLAPTIQASLLCHPPDRITERQLRPIAMLADWRQQEMLWQRASIA